jgi:hypothetical protein
MLMLVTHEAGHVVAAWLTGGTVTRVEMPLLGFSQTWVDPNPAPLIVASSGFLGGALIPFVLTAIWALFRKPPAILWFLLGFCLLANGAYLAGGAILRAGDARDLLRLGMSKPMMIFVGIAVALCGLWLWHISRCVSVQLLISKESPCPPPSNPSSPNTTSPRECSR